MEINNVFIMNPIINKPIVIFGTGYNAKRAYFTFLEMNQEIIGFADRKRELVGKKLFDKPIMHESELKNYNYTIVIAAKEWKNILLRLETEGIKNVHIMNMYGENDKTIEI